MRNVHALNAFRKGILPTAFVKLVSRIRRDANALHAYIAWDANATAVAIPWDACAIFARIQRIAPVMRVEIYTEKSHGMKSIRCPMTQAIWHITLRKICMPISRIVGATTATHIQKGANAAIAIIQKNVAVPSVLVSTNLARPLTSATTPQDASVWDALTARK